MTTAANLVEETREHLYSSSRDQLNTLAVGPGANDTTLTFTYALDQIQPGAEISIDVETIYVWATNESARTATVQRGYKGSTASNHDTGSLVYVNPLFSGYKIFGALNQEIRDLGAPPNGLFRVSNWQDTTQPVRKTYPVPQAVTTAPIHYILQVNYHEPGPEYLWIRMVRWEFEVLRQMPNDPTNNDGFAFNMAVKILRPMYPGRALNFVYATGFTEFSFLDDDAIVVTGLPASALDIPPLGAAARLMGVREAKRTFTESEVDTRRASEVPVGSASRAAQTLLELLNQRIRTELSRLLLQYPERR
jgi:hypothetical protein